MKQSNPKREIRLDNLFSKVSKQQDRNEKSSVSTPAPPSASGGLRPSDILFLPDSQRELISFLSRLGPSGFKNIQQALKKDEQQTLKILTTLKKAGYVHETLQGGKIHYRVKFTTISSRIKNNQLKELWGALNLDNATFLRQLSLFKSLTDTDLDLIDQDIKAEHYERNDVIMWQGESTKAFRVIKNGIVAVTNVSNDGTVNLLRYLEQGNFFGESGLLTDRRASATITAFTPVDILVIEKDDFYAMLSKKSEITIALARELAKRLSDTNTRLANKLVGAHLFVIIGAGEKIGASTISNTLALKLAASKEVSTAYLEFPQDKLSSMFGFSTATEAYSHPGGHQVLNYTSTADLPELAQIALIVDQAGNQFKNIVLCLTPELAEQLESLIRSASTIIIVTSPQRAAWQHAANLIAALKPQINASKTRLFTIVNNSNPDIQGDLTSRNSDYEIPYLETLPNLAKQSLDNLPEVLIEMIDEILELQGYTHQVGLYIPTTIGVDQHADTNPYVEKTLAFMGSIFGGATREQVQGVWNSNEVGLVEEDIYMVKSFCDQNALDTHMGEVIDYVEILKKDLQQEAMAVEVNQKLMLI